MKLLINLLILGLAIQLQAADKTVSEYKAWKLVKTTGHGVSDKAACVASTADKKTNSVLEIYAEANVDGGYVAPTFQIVTTGMDPALGIVASIDGNKVPMTISLSETKEIEVPAVDEETGETVLQKVEQQVFLGKFATKNKTIHLIRAKNSVKADFYNAEGKIGQAVFSLAGSSRTIKTLEKECL